MRHDAEANEAIQTAFMCKLFKCSPNELNQMDWDQVETMKAVFSQLAKENPMALFM